MAIYNDGLEYDINSATKALVHQNTCNNNVVVTECSFTTYKGKRVIKLEVEPLAMVELGYTSMVLSIYQGDTVVSIQPFRVLILDDYTGNAGSFVELIQDLQQQIESMVNELNNTIKLADKGVPNGVASLDENGRIPLSQMPLEIAGFEEHILQTVYKDKVHGMGIDDDGLMIYQNINGDWQYVGFPDEYPNGGQNQFLRAELSIVNGLVTVTYTGVPSVMLSKWSIGDKEVPYFQLDGNIFTGTEFEVTKIGLHTLYYKDSNGVEYVKLFNVSAEELPTPDVIITVEDGFVEVTTPTNINVSLKKWEKGNRDIIYFQYNGNVFTGNTFIVEEIGTYTIYIKTDVGNEYVYLIEVTQDMLKPITKPQIRVRSVTQYNNSTTRYALTALVKDDAYQVTKYKAENSNEYLPLATPIAVGEERYFGSLADIDFALANNKNREVVFGFENEIGQRTTLTYFADSNYLYYWISDVDGAVIANVVTELTNSSLIFPSSIKGRTIHTIGQSGNSIMQYNDTVTNVTIPSTVNKLYPIFNSSKVQSVSVFNPNMEYAPYNTDWYAFRNPQVLLTFRANLTSTTRDFVNNQANPLYAFATI